MEIGDSIPQFELPDQHGNLVKTEELLGKPLILFFYPKDFTPGCTRQACSFRDNMDEFIEKGVQVIGISSDSISSHANFASKYSLEYPILADEKQQVQKLFGVKKAFLGLFPGRETFVFNSSGTLVFKYRSLNPAGHLSSVMEYFKEK